MSPSWRPAERLTMVAMVVALGCAEGAASDGPGLTRAGGAGASPTAVSSGGVPSTVSTAGRPPDAEGLAPVDADLPSTDALVPVPDASAPPACLEFSEPRSVGNIELAELDQLSGLVASRTQPGVLFAHEDSTGAPTLYALETSGRALATFTLAAAPSTDWEDIAAGTGAGGESLLFIGDIGDNAIRNGGAPRDEIQVIRMPEPLVATGQAFVEATLPSFDVLRFRYPSGVHEAETLLVDPKSGDLLIITRSPSGDSRVFRASGATPPDTLTALEEVGNIAFAPSGQGALATAGDFSPNG
ncbi:MAG TPA: hypothetical protein VNN80_03620, partial [Polyangiaceae bacterium]|nr:hypothetical protein [Polyangiaceae bacterium]